MIRKILHLDLDAFYCGVEEQRDPTLRGKAFAVGGKPEERGVVASCSYPARAFGVRSAMPMSQAVRVCPGLLVIPAHFDDYRATSQKVMALLHERSELVEQISIDEAFLDVSHLEAAAEEIARELQQQINQQLNLSCSLGVASNKLVAKIANNIGKDRAGKGKPPNAILMVPPGEEAAFLAPLPTRELWGVGPKTAERLATRGIQTIGELAQYDERELSRMFGKNGEDMSRHARGIDNRPLETEHEIKSVSRETTFINDVFRLELLKNTLHELTLEVGAYLRKNELKGSTIKIKLRWSNFTTLTRQVTLAYPTDQDEPIFQAAALLLEKALASQQGVRLIGVGVSGFDEAPEHQQLSLWGD